MTMDELPKLLTNALLSILSMDLHTNFVTHYLWSLKYGMDVDVL